MEDEKEQLSVEDRARAQGWVPEDEYRGDPGKYVDAETFVARGEEIGAIRKERISALEKKISRLEQANAKFGAYHTETMTRLERQHAVQLENIKKAQRQAVIDGDVDRFDALEEQVKGLEETKIKDKAQVQEETSVDMRVVLQGWLDDGNEWYLENTKLAAEAFELGNRLAMTKPHLTGRAQLDEITRIMKKNHPDVLSPNGDKTEGRRETAVEGGDTTAGPRRGKSGKAFSDLPREAKDICDEFVRMIPGFTREQFLKDYDWEGK